MPQDQVTQLRARIANVLDARERFYTQSSGTYVEKSKKYWQLHQKDIAALDRDIAVSLSKPKQKKLWLQSRLFEHSDNIISIVFKLNLTETSNALFQLVNQNQNDKERLQQLSAQRQSYQRNIFHFVKAYTKREMVKNFYDLLTKGQQKALLQQQNKEGYSPCQQALSDGHVSMAQWLYKELGLERSELGNPLPGGYSPLQSALSDGHVSMAQWLYKELGLERSELGNPLPGGYSPFQHALSGGHVGMAQWLYKELGLERSELGNLLPGSTYSPFQHALSGGHVGMAQWLYKELGLERSELGNPLPGGYSPLQSALSDGHVSMAQWLYKELGLERSELGNPLPGGYSPFQHALSGGHVGMAQWLYKELGLERSELGNPLPGGYSPFQHALSGGHVGMAQWLYKELGLERSELGNPLPGGYSPLQSALSDGHVSMAQWLCKELGLERSELGNLLPDSTYSPFQHALSNGHVDMAQWLYKELGLERSELGNPLPGGYSPFQQVLSNGYVGMAQWLYKELGLERSELGNPLPGGYSPFQHALSGGHVDMAQWLYKELGLERSELGNPLPRGYSPFQNALSNGHVDMAQWLYFTIADQKILEKGVARNTTMIDHAIFSYNNKKGQTKKKRDCAAKDKKGCVSFVIALGIKHAVYPLRQNVPEDITVQDIITAGKAIGLDLSEEEVQRYTQKCANRGVQGHHQSSSHGQQAYPNAMQYKGQQGHWSHPPLHGVFGGFPHGQAWDQDRYDPGAAPFGQTRSQDTERRGQSSSRKPKHSTDKRRGEDRYNRKRRGSEDREDTRGDSRPSKASKKEDHGGSGSRLDSVPRAYAWGQGSYYSGAVPLDQSLSQRAKDASSSFLEQEGVGKEMLIEAHGHPDKRLAMMPIGWCNPMLFGGLQCSDLGNSQASNSQIELDPYYYNGEEKGWDREYLASLEQEKSR